MQIWITFPLFHQKRITLYEYTTACLFVTPNLVCPRLKSYKSQTALWHVSSTDWWPSNWHNKPLLTQVRQTSIHTFGWLHRRFDYNIFYAIKRTAVIHKLSSFRYFVSRFIYAPAVKIGAWTPYILVYTLRQHHSWKDVVSAAFCKINDSFFLGVITNA